jgi:hypothetical protein
MSDDDLRRALAALAADYELDGMPEDVAAQARRFAEGSTGRRSAESGVHNARWTAAINASAASSRLFVSRTMSAR